MKSTPLCLLILLTVKVASAQFQYLSPMPGALTNPEHNIIIREGHRVNPESLQKNLFTITGAQSGNHDFKMVLATDGKTIVLTPSTPFDFNEKVTVTIDKEFTTEAGNLAKDFSFSFTTHRRYTNEEQMRIKKQLMRSRFAEAAGDHSAASGNAGVRSEITGGFTIVTNKLTSPSDIIFDSWSASATSTSPFDGFHIITTDGDSVYSDPVGQSEGFEWDLNPNGYLAHWNMKDECFDVLDSNYQLIDKYYGANGLALDPHEFKMYPDGRVILIAYDIEFFDMSVYDYSYSEECTLTGSVIQEFDRDKNLIFEWRSFDHVAPIESNQDLSLDYLDYVHTNSVDIDSDGNIIASHRHLDQVTKINGQTGEFIWRMGGMMNQFTFVNDSEQFNFQHDARILANGHLTLWDNGDSHPVPHSTAKEYVIDETNHVATLVWGYSPVVASTGKPVYFYGMGSVQRLDNGNTFINGGWDSNPEQSNMWEVTPDGEVVWELKLNDDSQLISYRAHKRQWNPCAPVTPSGIQVNDITSRMASLEYGAVSNAVSYEVKYKLVSEQQWIIKNTSEAMFMLGSLIPDSRYEFQIRAACANGDSSDWSAIDTFSTAAASLFPEENIFTAQLQPNLGYDDLSLEWNLLLYATLDITIYDALGSVVEVTSSVVNPDMKQMEIDISNLSCGIYFMKVDENNSELVLPFAKQ